MFTLEGVSAGYGDHQVLDKVSLTIPSGKITALIGPNAAGKTTLLKMLARRMKPKSGEILLNERSIHSYTDREYAREVGYAPQHIPANITLSVGDTVALGAVPQRGWFLPLSDQDRALVVHTLDDLDLGHLVNRSFMELSGGEKQRVVLARMLVQKPRILLLDEPSAHLDPRHQVDLFQQLGTLSAEGYTILITLHDLSQAATWADEIAMLAHGHIEHFGTPEGVITEENLLNVYGYTASVIHHPETGKLLISPK